MRTKRLCYAWLNKAVIHYHLASGRELKTVRGVGKFKVEKQKGKISCMHWFESTGTGKLEAGSLEVWHLMWLFWWHIFDFLQLVLSWKSKNGGGWQSLTSHKNSELIAAEMDCWADCWLWVRVLIVICGLTVIQFVYSVSCDCFFFPPLPSQPGWVS